MSGDKTRLLEKKCKLTVDASDAGVSAVLLHERKDDIDLPNCYYSLLSTTKHILMNKVISHFYYIYITSPLLKKRFGYKHIAINLYFNSSQHYPTLDKTLAIQSSLHLICFIMVTTHGFSKEYKLRVDASDAGVVVVLL
jgi:hypothetical protein